jgi:ubiquinone/menaquinone biosynthesis C-methylase UbiE
VGTPAGVPESISEGADAAEPRVGLVWLSPRLCGAMPPGEFDIPIRADGIMDNEVSRQEVIMPGGIELTREAEVQMGLGPSTTMLSVACGTGELELFLAEKFKCQLVGIDLDEGFIRRAREKTAARNLADSASFEIGDGNSLRFEEASFDVVFCSGALCAFFENGLREFHRVLKPGGRIAVIDVIWRREDVPKEVADRWTEGAAEILTVNGNCAAFKEKGFRVLFSRAYHEPSWWDAYYQDRGTAPYWIAEYERYKQDQEYLGLGLFVIEKTAI